MGLTMSNHLGNKVLNAVFKGQNLSYEKVYLSLHTGDPGDAGGSEVEAGGYSYARKEVVLEDWTTPSDKTVETNKEVEWENLPDVTVSHIGIWDQVSDGNFLWSGELAESRSLTAGQHLRFKAGEITAEIDPNS